MDGKAKIRVLCIGRLKSGPEYELVEYYRSRLPWATRIEEMEDRKAGPGLKDREGRLLLSAMEKRLPATRVMLDEKGKEWSSREFADFLDRALVIGEVVFFIGGADGLASDVKNLATHSLAFGRMTWPHKLARVMLLEQLYRAGQILAQHPYHRD